MTPAAGTPPSAPSRQPDQKIVKERSRRSSSIGDWMKKSVMDLAEKVPEYGDKCNLAF